MTSLPPIYESLRMYVGTRTDGSVHIGSPHFELLSLRPLRCNHLAAHRSPTTQYVNDTLSM